MDILSDGWDRGDPELLDCEPLTRGMRAAVPHTDHLPPGNSLESIAQLSAILEGMG